MNNQSASKEDEKLNLYWRGQWWGYHLLSPINWRISNHKLIKLLKCVNGEKLLDVGCGSGKGITENLEWIQNGGTVVATDPDPTALSFLRRVSSYYKVSENVEAVELSAQDVNQLGSNIFDGAYSHFVYDKIPTHDLRVAAFESVFETLKPGGIFAVAVPTTEFTRHTLSQHIKTQEAKRKDIFKLVALFRSWLLSKMALHYNKDVDTMYDTQVFHRYSKDELEKYFSDAGFEQAEANIVDNGISFHATGIKPDK